MGPVSYTHLDVYKRQLYHRTLNVGRVQTPTLSLLATRDAKIALFQKEKYHHVRLTLAGGGAFAYVKFIKPNRSSVKVSADPDEYDFPDEEYVNERCV